MWKRFKKSRVLNVLIVAIMTPTLLLGLFANSNLLVKATDKTQNNEVFELSHFDGMNLENGYDTSLLYRNSTDFRAGDSGFIYVSEEEADKLNIDNKEEYGGYFYQYCSAGGVSNSVPSTVDGKTPSADNGTKVYTSHVMITRSKDLNNWEPCGEVDNGLGMIVGNDDWILNNIWAPECIYDSVTNKYYLYFSACSQINDGVAVNGVEKLYSSSENTYDRFYIGIAVSDSPAGPFQLVTSKNVYGDANVKNPNGKVVTSINPAIMIDKECDEFFYTDDYKNQPDFAEKDEIFSAIDIHPTFINGELYIYFVKHIATGGFDGNTIWGMKMKDMITPDYSTISMLLGTYMNAETDNDVMEGKTGTDIVRVEYKGSIANDPAYPRHLARSWMRYTTYEDGVQKKNAPNGSDMGVCEAPQMLTTTDKDGKTVYILSYSARGVDNYYYDVRMSYSYDPLEGFVKPTEEQGATILGVDKKANDYMSNLGHVQFLKVDGELWCCHAERQAPFAGIDQGRFYSLASVSWQYLDESLKFPVPVVNGPTTSLQPLPSVTTGYTNIASKATVTVNNDIGYTAKYLTDGMLVTNSIRSDREFSAKANSTKITLTYDEPMSIRGILLYNSYTYANAFKSVSKITFSLAETPSWHDGTESKCEINNLSYNVDEFISSKKQQLQPGSAAVATFDEIKVLQIEIEFDEDDKMGNSDFLNLSELMVLGTSSEDENSAKPVLGKLWDVKTQLRVNEKNSNKMDIRFITGIDSLQYEDVYFEIKVTDVTGKIYKSGTLKEKVGYYSILENGQTVTPNMYFEDAMYFVVHSLTGIPTTSFNDTFTVTTYSTEIEGSVRKHQTVTFSINDKIQAAETYQWSYEKPFGKATDTDMTIDGKLEETTWSGQNKMIYTESGVQVSATTVFTEKGLYIGLEALDENVVWKIRHDYSSNSAFKVIVTKENEAMYNKNNYNQSFHVTRHAFLQIDAKNCSSYRQTPYQGKAYVDGELNSGKTKSMSAELFLTWEDLHYTEEELGADGMPDTVELYINYSAKGAETNSTIAASFTKEWQFETYFHFGKDGLIAEYASDTIGNANNGPAASDKWTLATVDGKETATATEERLQVIWLKNAYLRDFIAETTIQPLDTKADIYNRCGFVLYKNSSDYKLFGLQGKAIVKGNTLQLAAFSETDAYHWESKTNFSETVCSGNYTADTVRLKVVKHGSDVYYFFDDELWKYEELTNLEDACYLGLFTNGAASFIDWKYTDFPDKQEVTFVYPDGTTETIESVYGSGLIREPKVGYDNPLLEAYVDGVKVENLQEACTKLITNVTVTYEYAFRTTNKISGTGIAIAADGTVTLIGRSDTPGKAYADEVNPANPNEYLWVGNTMRQIMVGRTVGTNYVLKATVTSNDFNDGAVGFAITVNNTMAMVGIKKDGKAYIKSYNAGDNPDGIITYQVTGTLDWENGVELTLVNHNDDTYYLFANGELVVKFINNVDWSYGWNGYVSGAIGFSQVGKNVTQFKDYTVEIGKDAVEAYLF